MEQNKSKRDWREADKMLYLTSFGLKTFHLPDKHSQFFYFSDSQEPYEHFDMQLAIVDAII